MAQPNAQWSELLSTTLRKYRKTLVDNIFKSNPLFHRLKDRQRTEDGGYSIVVQLEYGKNPNVGSYAGADPLPMEEAEIITSVEYNWKNYAGSVVITGEDQRKNNGQSAMINLLQSRIKNCENTMIEDLNEMFYGDGTGNDGKDLLGLSALIGNTGTLAGIDRSAHSWWQANVATKPGTETWGGTADTMHKAMTNMFYNCSQGNQKPDLIVTTQNIYELYENSLTPQRRYTKNDIADAGFISVEFKNTPLVYDEYAPQGEMIFLNTEFLEFVVHTQANFTPTPMLKPFNQDVFGNHILLMGNLTLSQARRQGKITGITES